MPFGAKLFSSSFFVVQMFYPQLCCSHRYTWDLYLRRCDSIAVKLFPVLRQVHVCITVFSAFRRPPRSALIANCNIEASNLGTESPSQTISWYFRTRAG